MYSTLLSDIAQCLQQELGSASPDVVKQLAVNLMYKVSPEFIEWY